MIYSVVILSFILCFGLISAQSLDLKLMTFNVDCRLCDKHAWGDRIDGLSDTIARHSPDLIGIQETMFAPDIDDLLSATGLDEYGVVCPELGSPEIKNKLLRSVTQGSVEDLKWDACIFYKNDRFEASDSTFFWLGPDPEKPGDFDMFNIPRLAVYALFTDKSTSSTFYFGSTHFDHGDHMDDGIMPSTNNCVKMAQELLEFTAPLAETTPMFWTCDCNSNYRYISSFLSFLSFDSFVLIHQLFIHIRSNAFAILTNSSSDVYLEETWDLSQETDVLTNQESHEDYDHTDSIDHIFLAQTETYKPSVDVATSVVDMYKYPCEQEKGGVCDDGMDQYPSDHWAIVSEMTLHF